jgi:uncharacterized protein
MTEKSRVYFIKLEDVEKIESIIPEFRGALGLKCHFGEKGNDAFVSAEYMKKVASMVGFPPLLETTVLYSSERSRASSHIALARDHGFDFADIDILDGEEGDESLEVKLYGIKTIDENKSYYLGKNIEKYDSLLVVSHFKGHEMGGFGGAIKNLAMGLASRRGKLDMHAGVKHQVDHAGCTGCEMCIKNCPVDAIALGEDTKANIDQEICVSCSKCISVCPAKAIGIPWGSVSIEEFQDRLSDYARAAVEGRQCYYINFVINIVPLCDCMGVKQDRLTDDIGILVSDDPVAIDQASFDLVCKQYPKFEDHSSENQLARGAEIGLGKRDYELVVKK